MKKKLFFAAVAIVALASCSSDELIGVTGPQDNSPSDESNAIVFASAFNWIFSLLLSCMNSLYILDINPLSDV